MKCSGNCVFRDLTRGFSFVAGAGCIGATGTVVLCNMYLSAEAEKGRRELEEFKERVAKKSSVHK